MRNRARFGCLALAVVGWGCLQPGPKSESDAAGEGGLPPGLDIDAGPMRPPTGEPLLLPDCDALLDDHGPASQVDGGLVFIDGAVVEFASGGGGGVGSSGGSGVMRPQAFGDIVITEIMSDPVGLADTQGEWVELHNPSEGDALDLQGCVVDDGGGSLRALVDVFMLAPGDFGTIGRTEMPGFVADAAMPISLSNGGDFIALVCDGVEIDRVAYGVGFPLAPGASMSLDPASTDASANDAAGVWCLADRPYSSDLGTPGAANPACFDTDLDAGM